MAWLLFATPTICPAIPSRATLSPVLQESLWLSGSAQILTASHTGSSILGDSKFAPWVQLVSHRCLLGRDRFSLVVRDLWRDAWRWCEAFHSVVLAFIDYLCLNYYFWAYRTVIFGKFYYSFCP